MGEIGISYQRHPYPACKNSGICKYMYIWNIPNSSYHFSLTNLNTCCLCLQSGWLNPWNIGWKIPESTCYWHNYTLNVLIWEKYNLCTNYFAFISDVQAYLPGHVAQSVTCLATDASLTADPGVLNSILAWSHTFVEIDHEIISTVILLPSAESYKKGCCQLQTKVCARSTG